jgi:alpha-tubulin suppressor-like RCC1 family protein
VLIAGSPGNGGIAYAFGNNGSGQCDVPPLPPDRRYVAVAAGSNHTVLVRDDGEALCFGQNGSGQCNVPPPPAGGRYVAAAAGMVHTVLWTEFGDVVAFGGNDDGRCSVPEGLIARVDLLPCFLEPTPTKEAAAKN